MMTSNTSQSEKEALPLDFILTDEDSELVEFIREHAGDQRKHRNEIEHRRLVACDEHKRLVQAECILNRG